MRIPQIVNLELTNRCNLECVFCDHSRLRHEMRLGQMEIGLLENILSSLQGQDIYELGLVGLGEPLLNTDLSDHLACIRAYEKNFERISLNSNATLLNPEKAELIADSVITMVTFSLNATNPESYLELMRRDLFQSAVQNIKTFIDTCRNRGREDMRISIQFMSSDLNHEREMEALFSGYAGGRVIVYNRYVFDKPAMDTDGQGKVNVNSADFSDRHPCWSMYSRVYIDIDGNVYPCTIGNDCYRTESELCVGNVKDANLI